MIRNGIVPLPRSPRHRSPARQPTSSPALPLAWSRLRSRSLPSPPLSSARMHAEFAPCPEPLAQASSEPRLPPWACSPPPLTSWRWIPLVQSLTTPAASSKCPAHQKKSAPAPTVSIPSATPPRPSPRDTPSAQQPLPPSCCSRPTSTRSMSSSRRNMASSTNSEPWSSIPPCC